MIVCSALRTALSLWSKGSYTAMYFYLLMGLAFTQTAVRPSMPETTALGAAMAAGAALGIWSLKAEDLASITIDTFQPSIVVQERDDRFAQWKEAVKRSMHWVPSESTTAHESRPASVLAGGFFAFISFALIVVVDIITRR